MKTEVWVTGTVTSFSADKGYGFVANAGGEELFVDPQAHQNDGASILAIGDRVRFVITEGPNGRCVSSARAY
ncbi:MAG: cold-shock protein [candidate division Zixibacteria bacterium]|nr:cold-shock protein [candidate division Zixibacteria bacterium]